MSTPPLFYVATSQPATGVTGSCSGHFTGLTPVDLVLAKGSHLEIHSVGEEGLIPVYDVALYGRIATMKLVRLQGEPRDTLVLTTERFDVVALAFDPESRDLRTVARGDLRVRT